MGKDIKFRAWDKGEMRMLYSDKADYPFSWGLGWNGIMVQEFDGINCVILTGLDFEEYTGLKDKNGREIYEGDIVRFETKHETFHNYEVIYQDGSFAGVYYGEDRTRVAMLFLMQLCGEVLGNIHENSELLEGVE